MRDQILDLFPEQTEWEELEALADLIEIEIGLCLTKGTASHHVVSRRKPAPVHLMELPDVTL